MRLIFALVIVLLTAGFPGCNVRRGPPVAALIDASCFEPVVDDVRWEGDPNDPGAWDTLAGEVVPALREKAATADLHRQACVQGLKRLDKARVIDLGR